MILRASFAILLLAIGSTGVPAWHLYGIFPTIEECRTAEKEMISELALKPFYAPAPLPAAISSTQGRTFKSPAHGQTVTATLSGATCEVVGTNIKSVQFFLNGKVHGSQENTAPWNCTLDPAPLANGYHDLRAAIVHLTTGAVENIQVTIIKGAPPLVPVTITGADAKVVSGCARTS